ncbi:hypothetical protein LRP67_20000 [Nocardioides sp. cx-169]|uniref:hypothetical protein n=1 Tax=Nocardioides sp. cx-169 TaxID=2899080 RepID=UPI001E59C6F2|nr:hypothetical protein [Nocardioides sp. cx-169]MCD4536382.1 hypothetical protein [Nocardioides sp. cx-169]
MTAAPVEGRRREVVHTVTVRHAVTRGPVPGVAVRLVPPSPWWWSVRYVAGAVVLHAQPALVAPDPDLTPVERARRRPRVRITVADPLVAATVENPTVELDVTGDHTHELTPVDQTVTVDLRTRTDTPATGRTVTLAPPGQPAIDLVAVAGTPGRYATDARRWTASETPFDLLVDGALVERHALQPFQTDTRLHAVTPA